ncbi:hypothetical protein BH18ACI5_BH18ACI5_14270 [soil metagenome]
MNDHNLRKIRLDDAIDNAVRDIVQLDPRSGLRRRVLSQLGGPVHSSSWMPRLLVPLGALTCILAAVFVLSSRQSAPVVATAPAAAPLAVPAAPVASSAAAPAAVTALPSPERITPSRPSQTRRVSTRTAIFGPRTGRVAAASVPAVPGGIVEAVAGGEPPFALRPLAPLVLPGLVIPPLDLPALTPVKKENE